MDAPKVAQRFEDLIAWQKARGLVQVVFAVTQRPVLERRYRFCDQIESAAVSVMNNIAEGYERGSRPEFARFLDYAKGSCGEVRSMTYVALDGGYIDDTEFRSLLQMTEETIRVISGLKTAVDRQRTVRRKPAIT